MGNYINAVIGRSAWLGPKVPGFSKKQQVADQFNKGKINDALKTLESIKPETLLEPSKALGKTLLEFALENKRQGEYHHDENMSAAQLAKKILEITKGEVGDKTSSEHPTSSAHRRDSREPSADIQLRTAATPFTGDSEERTAVIEGVPSNINWLNDLIAQSNQPRIKALLPTF